MGNIMTKISGPMSLSIELLDKAHDKAGSCYRILSEQLDLHYQVVLKMYEHKKIPNENYMLRIEKFLSKKNYTPRELKKGRPKTRH